MRKSLLITVVLFAFAIGVKAQIDTVNAQNNKLKLQNLKLGTSEYLIYITDSLFTKRTIGDIWQRTTSLKSFQNKQAIEFKWNWMKGDT
ncbi:MAG: hypothetical protein EOO85_30545, partial [Pedobacter sp.]